MSLRRRGRLTLGKVKSSTESRSPRPRSRRCLPSWRAPRPRAPSACWQGTAPNGSWTPPHRFLPTSCCDIHSARCAARVASRRLRERAPNPGAALFSVRFCDAFFRPSCWNSAGVTRIVVLGSARRTHWPWAGPRYASFLSAQRDYSDPRPVYSQRERIVDLASSDLLMGVRDVYTRWEMASGLAITFPYLDDDYVRFVGRIPSGAIFAGARERGLLRESMEGLVPDSVRYRMDKARGGDAFPELFRAMGGHEAMGDLGAMRELESLGILDATKFRLAFRRFAADPYADPVCWHALWGALTAEAYVHWFNDLRTDRLPLTFAQLRATAVS